MKTYSSLTLAFLLLILIVPQVRAEEPPKNREAVVSWADSSGNFKIEASFVEFMDGKVVVLKRASDGKKIKVPFDKLDEQSQSQAKSLSLLPPKNGKHVEYYESGKKSAEAHYKNGKLDGLVTMWRENGKKSAEGHYKNGKKEGPTTHWHENGQKEGELYYKDGELDGPFVIWHENGQKWLEGNYKDGELDGLAPEWDANGKKPDIPEVKTTLPLEEIAQRAIRHSECHLAIKRLSQKNALERFDASRKNIGEGQISISEEASSKSFKTPLIVCAVLSLAVLTIGYFVSRNSKQVLWHPAIRLLLYAISQGPNILLLVIAIPLVLHRFSGGRPADFGPWALPVLLYCGVSFWVWKLLFRILPKKVSEYFSISEIIKD